MQAKIILWKDKEKGIQEQFYNLDQKVVSEITQLLCLMHI